MGNLIEMLDIDTIKNIEKRSEELNKIYTDTLRDCETFYKMKNINSSNNAEQIQKQNLEDKKQQINDDIIKKIDICSTLNSGNIDDLIPDLKMILDIKLNKKGNSDSNTHISYIKKQLEQKIEEKIETNDEPYKINVDNKFIDSLKIILMNANANALNNLSNILKDKNILSNLRKKLEAYLRMKFRQTDHNIRALDDKIKKVTENSYENDTSIEKIFRCTNIDSCIKNKNISQAMFERFGAAEQFYECLKNDYSQSLFIRKFFINNSKISKNIENAIINFNEISKTYTKQTMPSLDDTVNQIFYNYNESLEIIDLIISSFEDLPDGNLYSNYKFSELIRDNSDSYVYHKNLLKEMLESLKLLRNQLNKTYISENNRINNIFTKLTNRIKKWSDILKLAHNKIKEVKFSISGDDGISGGNIFTKEDILHGLDIGKKRIIRIFSDNKYFPNTRTEKINLGEISNYMQKNYNYLSKLNNTVLENVRNSGDNTLIESFDFDLNINKYKDKYSKLKTRKSIEEKLNTLSISKELRDNLNTWCELYILQTLITDVARTHCYLIISIAEGCGLKMDKASLSKECNIKIVKAGFKGTAGGGWSTGPLVGILPYIGGAIGVVCGIGVLINVRDAVKNAIKDKHEILNGPSATPVDFFEILTFKKLGST